MTPITSGYFVTGGTLPTGSKSYVERQADRELIEALHRGEFCYILTARQMGKSSLMVRTAAKLREQGVRVAVLDLTAIGQNVTPPQWYDGLAQRLGRQLRLEDEIDDYWLGTENLGPCQRFFGAIRDVALPHQASSLVIFVDEIDAVRSLPFKTDEFFAAIREMYNRRTEDPELSRVTFCLLGVATPSDLVQDSRTTPFNIGRRIALSDFTPDEAKPLVDGLAHGNDGHTDMSVESARNVLKRILYWTGGQPFLTQRFCRAIKERNDAEPDLSKKLDDAKAVDRLCHELFLSHRSRESDDNLALVRNRLLNSDVDRAALLDIYRRVHAGRQVDDDETSPAINRLRLAGIVRAQDGRLTLRNRIYREVFDQKWIQSSLPEPEKLRQRQAFRSGLRRGLVAGLLLLLGLVTLAYFARSHLQEIGILRALGTLGSAYDSIARYSDVSELRREIELQGTQIISPVTNRFWMERPNRLRIETTMSLASEPQLVLVRNGTNRWIYSPDRQLYWHSVVTNSLSDTLLEFGQLTKSNLEDTLYRFLVAGNPEMGLRMEASDRELTSQERIGPEIVNVFSWRRRTPSAGIDAPVSAWVEPLSGIVRRLRTDYTGIHTNTELPGRFGPIPVQKLLLDVRHLDAKIDPPPFPPGLFQFVPPPQASKAKGIEELNPFSMRGFSSRPNRPPTQSELAEGRTNFRRRSPLTEGRLIDISSHYNAALSESWHAPNLGFNLLPFTEGPHIHRINGIEFDIRGVLQLASTSSAGSTNTFPPQVQGIAIHQRCYRIHFFQGTGWSAAPGTHIGSYRIRYEDGQERLVPIIYGYDVRDWIGPLSPQEQARGLRPAWTGTNSAGANVQLFHQQWTNPRSDAEIESIDFVSTMNRPAPFLLAITLEERASRP